MALARALVTAAGSTAAGLAAAIVAMDGSGLGGPHGWMNGRCPQSRDGGPMPAPVSMSTARAVPPATALGMAGLARIAPSGLAFPAAVNEVSRSPGCTGPNAGPARPVIAGAPRTGPTTRWTRAALCMGMKYWTAKPVMRSG